MVNLGSLIKGFIEGLFNSRRTKTKEDRASSAEQDAAVTFIKTQIKLMKDDTENGIFAKTGIARGSAEGKAITAAFTRFLRKERMNEMVRQLDAILDGNPEDLAGK